MPEPAQLERNLKFYTGYLALQNLHPWIPIFFLYFSERVSFSEVLALEAIYYASVVVLEVPSGYASDRWGRKWTLLASTLAFGTSYGLFAASHEFIPLAIAQAFLAGGIAFNSGTDTSFHHDTLSALGRVDEYSDREATLSRITFWSMALGAIIGGGLGSLDLRFPYLAGLAASLISIGLVVGMVEPEAHEDKIATPGRQIVECLQLARSPQLSWYFLFAVAAIVINHIPYEFVQPWLEQAFGESGGTTALVAGAHMAAVSFVAGWVGSHSVSLAERFGAHAFLLATALLQVLLIAGLAWLTTPFFALLLLARSAPGALQRAPLRGAIAPHIPSHTRATYLSIQSLTGRLSWSLGLWSLAWVSSVATEAEHFQLTLEVALAGSVLFWLGLVITARRK